MPLVRMPNGDYVDVPEGTSPEVLRRISANHKSKSGSAKARAAAPVDPERAEVNRRVQNRTRLQNDTKSRDPISNFLAKGLTSSFNDEIVGALSAGTRGVFNAGKRLRETGSIREAVKAVPQEYRVARDTERQMEARDAELNPGTAAVSEVAGALMNPLGTGARALQAVRGAGKIGRGVAKVGDKIASTGPVRQAIVAGGVNGALNAAGNSEDNTAQGAAMGAATGALTGGVMGATMNVARRGLQALDDREPANAARVAYQRVANLLDKSGKKPLTEERAALQMSRAERAGNDTRVMDLANSLRGEAGATARNSNIAMSNELVENAQNRIAERPELFENELRRRINPATGQDALKRKASVDGARKAKGQADYAEGGDMDAIQFGPSPVIDKWFQSSPDADRLMKRAYNAAMREGQDPAKIFSDVDSITGEVRLQAVPTFRAFDYLKREFDGEIGRALKAGDRTLAKGMSNHLKQLKTVLAEANPRYADILRAQRDEFQKIEALETGQDIIKRLRSEPRQLLSELNKMSRDKQEDARTGMADAILSLRDNKQDPVAFLASVTKSPNQRKVMEFAFGGRGNLSSFEKWMKRELRSRAVDNDLAPGRQSPTARFRKADENADEALADIAGDSARGYGFGGSVGFVGNLLRGFKNLEEGLGRDAKEELARILMFKGAEGGKELVKGVKSARKFKEQRKARNRFYAVKAAKGGQQLVTDYAGD